MRFIIAEVGSNFDSLEDCMSSIRIAKECGADAVKFQMYNHKDMYGHGQEMPLSCRPAWLPQLKEQASRYGIELMCTAFSVDALHYVNKFVSRHKIASSDLSYVDLLCAAAATGKPVILSTGASSFDDIRKALEYLDPSKTTLLYCVSAYPSQDVNLFHLNRLRAEFGLSTGYSCHTSDYMTAVVAATYHHAFTIEKHFKLKEMDTPDAPHSLLPDDFKKMVSLIRNDQYIKAVLEKKPNPTEEAMYKRHKRRLVATKPVSKGEALIYNQNYGCYRSLVDDLEGLPSFAYNEVNGKLTTKDLKPGDPITPTSIER